LSLIDRRSVAVVEVLVEAHIDRDALIASVELHLDDIVSDDLDGPERA